MKKLRNFVGMLLLAVLCTGCNMESEEAVNGKITEIESYGETFSLAETFMEKLNVMKELENLLSSIENKTFEEKFSDESYALFKDSYDKTLNEMITDFDNYYLEKFNAIVLSEESPQAYLDMNTSLDALSQEIKNDNLEDSEFIISLLDDIEKKIEDNIFKAKELAKSPYLEAIQEIEENVGDIDSAKKSKVNEGLDKIDELSVQLKDDTILHNFEDVQPEIETNLNDFKTKLVTRLQEIKDEEAKQKENKVASNNNEPNNTPSETPPAPTPEPEVETPPTPTHPVYTAESQMDSSKYYISSIKPYYGTCYFYIPQELLIGLPIRTGSGSADFDSEGNPIISLYITDNVPPGGTVTVYNVRCDGTIASTSTFIKN